MVPSEVHDVLDSITDFSTINSLTDTHTVEEEHITVNTDEKFTTTMKTVIKRFKDYVEKVPHDDYSIMIMEWFQNGLQHNIK